MAGLYIHIPFCKKACRYCDFHFSVSLNYKPEVIETIGIELINRLSELKSSISTLYFGGGTPSVLDSKELEYLMKIIYRERIKKNIEVTFEANPDDLTVKYLINLLESGINRLSIGIQSFNEKELVLLGRSHTVSQSYKAIENAFASGFTNINADLIYGIPGMKTDQLEKNLSILTGYHINHI